MVESVPKVCVILVGIHIFWWGYTILCGGTQSVIKTGGEITVFAVFQGVINIGNLG